MGQMKPLTICAKARFQYQIDQITTSSIRQNMLYRSVVHHKIVIIILSLGDYFNGNANGFAGKYHSRDLLFGRYIV